MRVGIIALQHESNTFLSTPTTLDDFQRGVLASGEAMLRHYGSAHHEVGGFIQGLRDANIEAVPVFAAGATPSGTIVAGAYQSLLEDGTLDTERCVMVQVATPTREGVEHYQNERHEIEQLVSEINGVHGRLGYPAIHYL